MDVVVERLGRENEIPLGYGRGEEGSMDILKWTMEKPKCVCCGFLIIRIGWSSFLHELTLGRYKHTCLIGEVWVGSIRVPERERETRRIFELDWTGEGPIMSFSLLLVSQKHKYHPNPFPLCVTHTHLVVSKET